LNRVLLHVTNGDSAGNTLRQTSLGGDVLPWRDALHEGPVPDVPRRELLATRARFLANSGWGSEDQLRAGFEQRDQRLLDAFRNDDHVVLWFEHDLYDQLQLVDILALAHDHDATPELIVIGEFPGRPDFRGLGELSADELESLWPSRVTATPAVTNAAADAWATIRAPEPTGLAGLAPRELPFLAAAIERWLEELPAASNGLSTTERHALEAIAKRGARTPKEAFVAAQELEPAPFLGDTWFHRALDALNGTLVEDDDGLRLTPTGERVLRNEADRVDLLGIDRWIGGTHVTPDSLWRLSASGPSRDARRRPPAR
jgi:hypothetical protein